MPVPPDFAQRAVGAVSLDAGALLRLHPTALGPLHFGKGGLYRFDDPAQGFGVLYAAESLTVAMAETLIRDRFQQPLPGGMLPMRTRELEQRSVAYFAAAHPLLLADLTGVSLLRLGGDAAELQSEDYPGRSQPWAAAVHAHPGNFDGILYQSRYVNTERAVALFERGAQRVGLRVRETVPLLQAPGLSLALDSLHVAVL